MQKIVHVEKPPEFSMGPKRERDFEISVLIILVLKTYYCKYLAGEKKLEMEQNVLRKLPKGPGNEFTHNEFTSSLTSM